MGLGRLTWESFVLAGCIVIYANPAPILNVALLICDDIAMDAVSAYRAARAGPVYIPNTLDLHRLFKHIHTPAIDQMAAEGVLFTRAYTSAPICSPSRYSLMTGKYPSRSQSARDASVRHPNVSIPVLASLYCDGF